MNFGGKNSYNKLPYVKI